MRVYRIPAAYEAHFHAAMTRACDEALRDFRYRTQGVHETLLPVELVNVNDAVRGSVLVCFIPEYEDMAVLPPDMVHKTPTSPN